MAGPRQLVDRPNDETRVDRSAALCVDNGHAYQDGAPGATRKAVPLVMLRHQDYIVPEAGSRAERRSSSNTGARISGCTTRRAIG